MSDLISRGEALKALLKVPCKIDSDNYTWIRLSDAFGTIDEDVPSAEPERRWIPVTEALPEEDIDVLLQFPHTMSVGYQEDGFWNIVTCDDLYSGLDEEDEKPIAWMPTPEPWRGE